MRVLFLTLDRIGRQRAGPAIRCWELAHVLAQRHEVTVASLHASDLDSDRVRLLPDFSHRTKEFRDALRSSEVLVVQGPALAGLRPALYRNKYLVVDLYDPYLLEYLAHPHPGMPRLGYLRQWHFMNEQLLLGDFFLCANERQRDYWLGRFCALGRLNPDSHQLDPSFRALLDVVPFGMSSQPPQRTRPALRGVIPGIGADDLVLLWAGGIWEWFDPLTVVRAVAAVSAQLPQVKLLFLGTRHPNPGIGEMPILERTRNLARELGVLNRAVFFNEGWVPFEDRQNYLLEADAGISAHQETTEMRLAFRTRVLDYIWAGLPMILSQGDYFADWVEREQAGLSVAPGDVEGWKRAITRLATDAEFRNRCRERLHALAPSFYWETVAAPLLRYCDEPYHTPKPSRWLPRLIPSLVFVYRQWARVKARAVRLRERLERPTQPQRS